MKLRDEVTDKIATEYCNLVNSFGSVEKNLDFNAAKWGAEKGIDACEAHYLQIIEKLESALKFYSLKSNYSLVDEGRNYHYDYKCYELNEITYADEELGKRAKEALAELEQFKNKMNGGEK